MSWYGSYSPVSKLIPPPSQTPSSLVEGSASVFGISSIGSVPSVPEMLPSMNVTDSEFSAVLSSDKPVSVSTSGSSDKLSSVLYSFSSGSAVSSSCSALSCSGFTSYSSVSTTFSDVTGSVSLLHPVMESMDAVKSIVITFLYLIFSLSYVRQYTINAYCLHSVLFI